MIHIKNNSTPKREFGLNASAQSYYRIEILQSNQEKKILKAENRAGKKLAQNRSTMRHRDSIEFM